MEIRAGGGGEKCTESGGIKVQVGNDGGADGRRGCRCEADYRNGREGRSEVGEVGIGRAEVVTPL